MQLSDHSLRVIGVSIKLLVGISFLYIFSMIFVGEDSLIPPSLFTAEGRAKRAEITEMLDTVSNLAEAEDLAYRAPYGSTLNAMAKRHYRELSEWVVASAKTVTELRQACEESHYSIKFGSACKRVRDMEERDLIRGHLK